MTKLNEYGQVIDDQGNTGYAGHFTGAWICYSCGALCDDDCGPVEGLSDEN